eukprot:6011921-Pyramimonas_sp.AAC.1
MAVRQRAVGCAVRPLETCLICRNCGALLRVAGLARLAARFLKLLPGRELLHAGPFAVGFVGREPAGG